MLWRCGRRPMRCCSPDWVRPTLGGWPGLVERRRWSGGYADRHRLGSGEASRLVKTARALREQLPATASAMTGGGVRFSHAEVIVDSLKDLSDGIAPERRVEGEQTLIGACASLDPVKLGAGPPAGGTPGPRRSPSPGRGQDPRPRAARVRETRVHPESGPVRVLSLIHISEPTRPY